MPLVAAIHTDRPDDGTAVVAPVGNLDVYSAPDMRDTLIGLLHEARYRQVVDLRRVDLLDSTGLGVIVGAVKRARARGGNLVLVVDLDSRPGNVLRITGVLKAIGHAASVDEALELLAPEPVVPVVSEPDPRPSFWPPRVGDVWLADIAADIPQPWTCTSDGELRSSGFPQAAQWVWDTYGPLRLVWRDGAVVTAMHSSELSA